MELPKPVSIFSNRLASGSAVLLQLRFGLLVLKTSDYCFMTLASELPLANKALFLSTILAGPSLRGFLVDLIELFWVQG